jgi:hypothetical protein
MLVKIAQLVEHSPEERRVGGSSPPLDTKTKQKLGTITGPSFCLLSLNFNTRFFVFIELGQANGKESMLFICFRGFDVDFFR